MDLQTILLEAKEKLGSQAVFAAPYEKNGVTVIPAARVMGGAGGGEGQMPTKNADGEIATQGTGFGGGFGLSGHPTGAFVIKGDEVKWLPAVDVNRLMLGFQVVMVVFFLAIRSIAKARATSPAV